jgi:hypothetical protein
MLHWKTGKGTIRGLGRISLIIGLCNLPLGVAYAQTGGINWNFQGFGSVAGVQTDEDRAEFRRDVREANGADKDLDFGQRSNLGAQLSVNFNEQWSATAQAVAKRRGEDDMDPDLEWLYAAYKPHPWFNLRAGRLVMPELLISDYRSVHFAQPTIGPPAQVYIFGSITSFDGAQVLSNITLGDGILTLQLSGGSAEEEFFFTGFPPQDIEQDNIQALNVRYEWGNWLVRGVTMESDITQEFTGAVESEFQAYGVQYDNGSLSMTSEFLDREGVAEAAYLQLGYRFGKWQPSVTYTELDMPGFGMGDIETDGTSLALRYDLTSSVALKLQYEEANPMNFWMWTNTPAFPSPYYFDLDNRKITSFSVDFIF